MVIADTCDMLSVVERGPMKGIASTIFIGTMRGCYIVFVDAGQRNHDGLKMAAQSCSLVQENGCLIDLLG